MLGHIYFATNPSMPGLVKIGVTHDSPDHRISGLFKTGVPHPFTLIAVFAVRNAKACERLVFDRLAQHRVAKGREIFTLSPAASIQKTLDIIQDHLPPTTGEVTDAVDDSHPFPDLSEEEEEMLWVAVDRPRGIFYETHNMINRYGADEIDGNYLLGELKKKGYLKEVKQGRNEPSLWELAHRGYAYARWIRGTPKPENPAHSG
jgi:hypothetical protein